MYFTIKDETVADADSFQWFNTILSFIWVRSLRQYIFRQFKRNMKNTKVNSSLKLLVFDIGKNPPNLKNIVINR